MKVLLLVAIFLVYFHSITAGLKCYSCFDGIEDSYEAELLFGCNEAYERNCNFTEKYCVTLFRDNKNDNLACDKDFCLFKECGLDASYYGIVCETAGTHDFKDNQSGQIKTVKYSCCEGDLCNKAGIAEYKSSLSNENSSSNKNNSLNQIALLYVSALCFYIACCD